MQFLCAQHYEINDSDDDFGQWRNEQIQQLLAQSSNGLAVWLSGIIVGRINEVTLRRAGLVLRWVTVRGYTVLVLNQATQAHSAWPSLCR